jgi:hypothetical protein
MILILSGLLYAFWSLKKRLIHNFISVGYGGALAVTCLIVFVEGSNSSPGQEAGYVVAAILTGAVLGGLSSPFAVLTEGAGCFLGGFCLSMWVMCLKSDGLITSKAASTVFILATSAAIGILGFVRYTRDRALTVCVPFSGATAVVLGIDCFTKSGLKEFWVYIWNINSNLFPLNTNHYPVTRPIRVETSCIMVVFLVALVVNVKFFSYLEKRKAERKAEKQRQQEELDRIESEAGMRTEMAVSKEKLLWERKYGNKGDASQSNLGSMESLKRDSFQDTEHRHSSSDSIEMLDMEDGMGRRINGRTMIIEVDAVEYAEKTKKKTIRVKNRPPSPSIIPLPFGVNTINPSTVPLPPSKKSGVSVEYNEVEDENEDEEKKPRQLKKKKNKKMVNKIMKWGRGADLEEDKGSGSEQEENRSNGDASSINTDAMEEEMSRMGSRRTSIQSALSMLVFDDQSPDGASEYNSNRASMYTIASLAAGSDYAGQDPDAPPMPDALVEKARPRSFAGVDSLKPEHGLPEGHGNSGRPKSLLVVPGVERRSSLRGILRRHSTSGPSSDVSEETKKKAKQFHEELQSGDSSTAVSNDMSDARLPKKTKAKKRASKLSSLSLQQLAGNTSSRLTKAYKQHKIFEWAKESTLADTPAEEQLEQPPSPGVQYEQTVPDAGVPAEEIEIEVEEPAKLVESPLSLEGGISPNEQNFGASIVGLSPSVTRQNSTASLRQRPSRTFSSPLFGQSALQDEIIEEEPEEIHQLPEKDSTLLGQREYALRNRLSNVNFNAINSIPVSAFGNVQAPNIAMAMSQAAESLQSMDETDELPLSVRKKMLHTRRSSSRLSMAPVQRSSSYGALDNRDSMISAAPYQTLSDLSNHRLSNVNAGTLASNAGGMFDSHQPQREDGKTPEERAARLASWRVSLQQDPRHARDSTLAMGDMRREQMVQDKRMKSHMQKQQTLQQERMSQMIDQTMRAPDAVMLHMRRLSEMQAQVKLD